MKSITWGDYDDISVFSFMRIGEVERLRDVARSAIDQPERELQINDSFSTP